jgi:hypothetical protein
MSFNINFVVIYICSYNLKIHAHICYIHDI